MTLRLPWRRGARAPLTCELTNPAVVVHGDDGHGPRPIPGPPAIPVGEDRCTCGGTLTPTGCTTPGDPQ